MAKKLKAIAFTEDELKERATITDADLSMALQEAQTILSDKLVNIPLAEIEDAEPTE